MKAEFYDKYFNELNEEQIDVLKKIDITKENMSQYSYITDEEGYINRTITDEIIDDITDKLGINELPKSYIEYLKTYGDGGWGEIWIYGIFKSKGQVESRLLDVTLRYREEYNLKKELICIAIGSGLDGYIFFFDTSKMCDGECPVVVFNERTQQFNEYANNFDEFVRRYIAYGIEYYIRTDREIEEEKNPIKLIKGTGYKCSWLVLKGITKKKLEEVLKLSNKKKMTWDTGLEFVYDTSKINEHRILISSNYNNKIYVIGNGLFKIANNPEVLLKLGEMCKEVCFYLTERVSETHCFAKISKGEIRRFYFCNEDEIINIGKITAIEKQLKVKFPANFNEAFDNKYTEINEEHIIQIANKWSPEDLNNYPYKDVVVALFEGLK